MKIEVGDIVKINSHYYEVTGTSLLEGYGFIEVILVNDDTSEEARVNVEAVILVWKFENSVKLLRQRISDLENELNDLNSKL